MPGELRYRHLRWKSALLGCLLLVLACRPWPAPETLQHELAVPDAQFTGLFERSGGGWTGGDGTLSVLLPDGRSVWLFGDTFLGTVSPNGTRPADAPFIRNSLVAQKGNALNTLLTFEQEGPAAFFQPPGGAGQWYWPGDATVEQGRLKIFLHRFQLTEPRLWAWRWIGADIATLSLPDLQTTGIAPAPPGNGILYGVCLLETEVFTYIYGVDDARTPKQAHLARARAGRIQSAWEYCTGKGWSDHPDKAVSILAGVSTQYAVIRVDDDFYLFSMDGWVPFSNELVAYRAKAPCGPWQGPLTIYTAPETTSEVIAYNPFAHPQFNTDDQLLISYNLNHISDPAALYRDASIYRPRFIRVDLPSLAARFAHQLHIPAEKTPHR